MTEGIYSIPFEQYEAIDAASKHGLDALAISPLHHWHLFRNPERFKKPETPAKLLGNAIHTSILEPERFDAEYIEEPQPPNDSLVTLPDYQEECRKRKLKVTGTKPQLAARLLVDGLPESRLWELYYKQVTEGKKVLSTPDWRVVKAIMSRVRKHPAASELLKYGKAEQSIFWTDPDTEVKCKGRVDWLCLNHLIVDLKSTNDAGFEGFQRAISKYRYYVQAAMYTDGLKALGFDPEPFVFAAWEKHPPYASALYYATDEMLAQGRAEYKRLLKIYADCLSRDKWPGYPQDILPINLPEGFKESTKIFSPESELDDNWLEQMGE